MKKILIVALLSTLDWGKENLGGVDSVCQILIKYLEENPNKSYEYRVIAFNPFNNTQNKGKLVRLSENIEAVQYDTNPISKLPGILSQLYNIHSQVKQFKPDLIHTHSLHWALSGIYKAPTLTTVHSYKKIGRMPRSILNNIFHEKIVPSISRLLVNEYTVVGDLLKRTLEQDTSKKIKVVYNPIMADFFQSSKKVRHDKFTIVTCGILTPRKGINFALQVIKQLKDRGKNVKFNIIGSDLHEAYANELKNLSRQLGIDEQVFFMGRLIGTHAVVEQYQKSDLGLFLSNEETFGLVPIEMLAAGLPLIATKVGILEDKQQEFADAGVVLIDNNDIEDIADKVEMVIKGDYKAFDSSTLDQFKTSDIVKRFEDIYKEMLADV